MVIAIEISGGEGEREEREETVKLVRELEEVFLSDERAMLHLYSHSTLHPLFSPFLALCACVHILLTVCVIRMYSTCFHHRE